MMKRLSLLFLALAVVTSCSHAISPQLRKEADTRISFQQLLRDPEQYRGRTLILGGRIANTSVQKDQTWIEIVQSPLGQGERPENTDISYGRFLVHFSDYLDPMIYAPGRLITVAGVVEGRSIRPLNKIQYSYPVLRGREAYLWKVEDFASEPRFHFGVGFGTIFH